MKMNEMVQRKGEAEMAVADWLYTLALDLEDDEAILTVITSGDINAILIHLFTISVFWPKHSNGNYRNPVFVKLLKAGGVFDLYNITGILEAINSVFPEPHIGKTLSLGLSLRGDDFLPRFQTMTHQKIIQLLFSDSNYRDGLFNFTSNDGVTIHGEVKIERYLKL